MWWGPRVEGPKKVYVCVCEDSCRCFPKEVVWSEDTGQVRFEPRAFVNSMDWLEGGGGVQGLRPQRKGWLGRKKLQEHVFVFLAVRTPFSCCVPARELKLISKSSAPQFQGA